MDQIRHTFSKSERLCSTKIISELFESGEIFHTSLLKVVWMYSPVELEYPAQVAFSVSKRSFRRAVTRNLIKRRLREAYRKNKHILYEHLVSIRKQIVFTVVLKGDAIPDYISVEKNILMIIRRLISLTAHKEKC